jgi:hypothetical protein
MQELVVRVANRPGMLASISETIAEAGVNIEALAAFGFDDEGMVRLLVDNAAAARRALRKANIHFDEREILTTVLPHEPGSLAGMAHQLAKSAINIEAIYALGADPAGIHVALAVSDRDAAAAALGLDGKPTAAAGLHS